MRGMVVGEGGRSSGVLLYQLRGYHSSVNLKFGLTLLLISLNNKIILYVKSNTLVMNCFLDNIRLPAITANRNVKCMGNIIYQ